MKKILKIKLMTDDFQNRALKRTMGMFSEVQNEISERAFKEKEYRKFQVHKIVYHAIKQKYKDFSSQLIIRAIDNVSNSYKNKGQQTNRPHGFKNTGAVVYDERIISFKQNLVNIWTTEGRLKIPIHIWNMELFKFRKGQCDLINQNGTWFLVVTVDISEKTKYIPKECIGVDLGIKKIAITSDGDSYSGEILEKKRKKFSGHRSRLQKCGTRSAKRRLKTIGKKESLFRKDVNHCISKKLIEKAKGSLCALALEELKGINKRVTVRKSQRNERMSWSFFQLRSFLEYKALEQGVEIILIPSFYTSQTCSNCNHCEKKNRKNQSEFLCLVCGFATNADYNASLNIKFLGDQSISLLFPHSAVVASPRSLGVGS